MRPKKARAIHTALARIVTNPFSSHANVRWIKGRKNFFRLRAGDWRAIYFVDTKARTMTVELIETRGQAYKR